MCILKALKVYVFDDVDPDESSYLGIASIPLIPLAHDKSIHGKFDLIKVQPNFVLCFVYCTIFFHIVAPYNVLLSTLKDLYSAINVSY